MPSWLRDLVESLVAPLRQFGWLGGITALAVIGLIGWIVTHPLDASRRFWQGVSFVFTAFTRRYAKAAVEAEANQFLSSKLFARVANGAAPVLRVDWVEKPEDARLHTDGAVIVRLRRDRDQSRNVLMTVWSAIGHINFTHARPYLEQRLVTAVDLEVLRLLANLLGPRAQSIFSTEMLMPRVSVDASLQPLLPILHDIQTHGLFEQVLLQEFVYLSERLRSEPARSTLPEEAQRFVDWLHSIATRAPHDERGSLDFITTHFRVAFILAAKTMTAALGTPPYVRRLGIHLLGGARSIYLLGLTSRQTPLCEEISAEFDKDRRVTRKKVADPVIERNTGPDRVRLVHYLRNELYMPEGTFAEQLAVYGVAPQKRLHADVLSVSDSRGDLRIGPLDARVANTDIAWGYRGTARRFIHSAQSIKATVLEIDNELKLIHVGIKQNLPSPWDAGLMPRDGENVRIGIVESYGNFYVVRLLGRQASPPIDESQVTLEIFIPDALESLAQSADTVALYGRIPHDEWSWFAPESAKYIEPTVGSEHEVEVLIANQKSDDLIFSRQAREVRNWEDARIKYPKGARVRATVVQVLPDALKFELEPGIFGRVPGYKVQSLGHELQDFQSSVVPGAKYDVMVTGIKQRRKEFRLELARATQ